MADVGRWYFRVVEGSAGRWTCRCGRQEVDDHGSLPDALAHISDVAAGQRPSQLFIHHANGAVVPGTIFD